MPDDSAAHAEALQRNPLLMRILGEIREDCLQTWENSGNPAQREEQWNRLQAAKAVTTMIQRSIDTAKLARGRDARAGRRVDV